MIDASTFKLVQTISLPSNFPPKSKIAKALFSDYMTLFFLAVMPTKKSYLLKYEPMLHNHQINWQLVDKYYLSSVDTSTMCIEYAHDLR